MKISELTSNQLAEYVESLPMPTHLLRMIQKQFTKRIIWVKDQRGRCSHCGTVHLVDKPFKDGDAKVCDACWSTATLKHQRKNSNFSKQNQVAFARIIRRDQDIIIQSTYRCVMTPKPTGEEFEYQLEGHSLLQGKVLKHLSRWWCWSPTDGFQKPTWEFRKKASNTGYWYFPEYTAHDDWDELFDGLSLKYAQFDKYIEYKDKYPEKLIEALHILAKYPMLEMVWKSGMVQLYDDFIHDEPYKRESIKALKHHKKQLKGKNPQMHQLANAWELVDRYGADISLALECATFNISLHRELLQKLVQVKPINEILRYLNKHAKNAMFDHHYRDYINLMDKIGTPVNESTIFPKDFDKAHNEAVDKFNAIKHEKDNGIYSKRLTTLIRLEKASFGLMIIVPKGLHEILREGRELHHCVGSYVDKVAKGETTILFVRKADDPEKPYFTMEYRDNKIIQLRGLRNQDAPKEVKAFVDQWQSSISKKKPRVDASLQPALA